MTITIPDDVLNDLQLTSAELRIEIAAYLYEKKRLSMGKARSIAGLGLIEFQKELTKRDIYLQISPQDIEKDISNLKLQG